MRMENILTILIVFKQSYHMTATESHFGGTPYKECNDVNVKNGILHGKENLFFSGL